MDDEFVVPASQSVDDYGDDTKPDDVIKPSQSVEIQSQNSVDMFENEINDEELMDVDIKEEPKDL